MEQTCVQQQSFPDWARMAHTELAAPWDGQQETHSVLDEVSGLEKRIESLEHMLTMANKSHEMHTRKTGMLSARNFHNQAKPNSPSYSFTSAGSSSAGSSNSTQGPSSDVDTFQSSPATQGKAYEHDTNRNSDVLSRVVAVVSQLRSDVDAMRADVSKDAEVDSVLSVLKDNALQMRDALVVLTSDMASLRADVQSLVSRQEKQEQIHTWRFGEQDRHLLLLRDSTGTLQAHVSRIEQEALGHAKAVQSLPPGLPHPQRSQMPTWPVFPPTCAEQSAPGSEPWRSERVPETMFHDTAPRNQGGHPSGGGKDNSRVAKVVAQKEKAAKSKSRSNKDRPEEVSMDKFYFGAGSRGTK